MQDVTQSIKTLYLAGLQRLLWMAMNTGEGVDMFVHWSGHVQWVHVSINHNCPYQKADAEDYDDDAHEPVYKAIVTLDQDYPITDMERVIIECETVLEKLSVTNEEAA
ncbi:hypothetical protein [Endozoicomonas sp.]|uniref:hypothetical protein n=1 Tax=Endozoicomonas sp. TaxID=1892382 RepID=UPI00383A3333